MRETVALLTYQGISPTSQTELKKLCCIMVWNKKQVLDLLMRKILGPVMGFDVELPNRCHWAVKEPCTPVAQRISQQNERGHEKLKDTTRPLAPINAITLDCACIY
ncbi:hypothetical protein PROFUN_14781 [Planoprotostelium fungivorum]|uniref:Uncharacterized protein n=1 Tax=Planoprotostelium fungivorum TaxID=1890364 RepID=A0A2P6MYK8_9EUKA|nr:hypothetical protein PROFUN_14781 [Planoprotostelium fungivorum]